MSSTSVTSWLDLKKVSHGGLLVQANYLRALLPTSFLSMCSIDASTLNKMPTLLDDPALYTKIEDLPPGVRYVASGAIFREPSSESRNPQLLSVKRAADEKAFPDHWELPGGKVDPGETVREGLAREVYEETGLVVQEVVAKLTEISWTSPKGQKWVQYTYVVTVRQPVEVRLDPVEHGEWRWSFGEDLAGLGMRLPNQVKLMAEAFEIERERLAVRL